MKLAALLWGIVGASLVLWAVALIFTNSSTVAPFDRVIGMVVGNTAMLVARRTYLDEE